MGRTGYLRASSHRGITKGRRGPKRLQVPKACTNCRKNHAGCGVERPCHRCIQNGLAATCVDIPRKKRESSKKKLASNAPSPISVKNINQNEPLQIDLSFFAESNIWEETYNEVFGMNSNVLDLTSRVKMEYPEEELLLTEFSEQPPTQLEITPLDTISRLNQEILSLKEDKKNLEQKISSLSYGFLANSVKEEKSAQNQNAWHIFQYQNEIGISLWKKENHSYSLIECNDKFIELSGIPFEKLKENFSFENFSDVESFQMSNQNISTSKKLQIKTEQGERDLTLQISPITSQDGKYFFSQIYENSK